jgi:diadenosine tetraphosphate (Ap4A) HIT family hydrolase
MHDNPIEELNKDKRRIHEGKYWNVILSYNQGYLGRCIVYLKSRQISDVLMLNDEERTELWEDIMPRLSKAINAAFAPDRINYAHLANLLKHVHWHVVPRHDSPKVFEGVGFSDDNVGGHFRSGKKELSEDMLDKIYERIRKQY